MCLKRLGLTDSVFPDAGFIACGIVHPCSIRICANGINYHKVHLTKSLHDTSTLNGFPYIESSPWTYRCDPPEVGLKPEAILTLRVHSSALG